METLIPLRYFCTISIISTLLKSLKLHLEVGVIVIQCFNYLTESPSSFLLSTNSDCFKSLIMTKERRLSIIELKGKCYSFQLPGTMFIKPPLRENHKNQ